MIPPARKVLIALDPGMSRESVLQAVVSLGGETDAAIQALFVEDATLFEMARLSIAREVTLEAAERSLAAGQVERQFRSLATRLRTWLETEAGRVGIHCDFRIARGDVTTELLRAASVADVLVLAHSRLDVGRTLSQRLPLRALLSRGPRTLVFVQERWSTGRRVVVLFTGPESESALQAALAIAERESLELSILQAGSGARGRAQEVLLGATSKATIEVRLRSLAEVSLEDLLRVSIAEDARVLVLPGEFAADDPVLVTEFLKRASCSIITVR